MAFVGDSIGRAVTNARSWDVHVLRTGERMTGSRGGQVGGIKGGVMCGAYRLANVP